MRDNSAVISSKAQWSRGIPWHRQRDYSTLLGTTAALLIASQTSAAPIAPPPSGKLYHGFYYGGVGTDTHDPTEHDVTPADVARYEELLGAKTTWVYFSNNWFESRSFPLQTCSWIRSLEKIPYVRLMLRSDLDQGHAERTFSLTRIIQGRFDEDLRAWATAAKTFGSPILVEWGTEPNGKWFSWNGSWNGGVQIGPGKYIAAYRHIVDLMRSEGAHNLQWVWHVNWFDEPETRWNRFQNYFPGDQYCDWVAVSVYGPLTPRTQEGGETFRFKFGRAYRQLTKLAPTKPIILAEFGCALRNPRCNAAEWARGALEEIFSGNWPALIGFCWWNEGWQNDNHTKHDTDMIIWHDADLTRVFREELHNHSGKIQSPAVLIATGNQ